MAADTTGAAPGQANDTNKTFFEFLPPKTVKNGGKHHRAAPGQANGTTGHHPTQAPLKSITCYNNNAFNTSLNIYITKKTELTI